MFTHNDDQFFGIDEERYERKNRKKFLCYPQDKSKKVWDLMLGICLITSCLTIPFYLAIYFHEEEPK